MVIHHPLSPPQPSAESAAPSASSTTKVSVVIPAFNQARYLAQAIESVLNQTHPQLEIIVVDDGSTDETPQVLARFAKCPSVKVVSQTNAGLPAARNRGLQEATGDYVCFLDSDDYYAPEKISKQAQRLDEDPELGLVYCDIVTVDEAGQAVAEQYSIGKIGRVLSGLIFQSLILGGYFPPHTVMIRRSVLTALGPFDAALGGHADYELWLRVTAAGHRACYLDEPLAFYRTHPNSMSKDGLHMNETRIATFRKLAALYPAAVGEGVHALQSASEDLFQANHWLSTTYQAVAGENEALRQELPPLKEKVRLLEDGLPADAKPFAFLDHLPSAKLAQGKPAQLAVWEATLDGASNKAIYLQPPAELVFTVPTGVRGCLITALAIHPDAWDKPGAGGCEFHIRVDNRLACVMAIDPAHLPADRHWHPIKLALPENQAGSHRVSLATKSIGNANSFRWALWRAPVFIAAEPSSALASGI